MKRGVLLIIAGLAVVMVAAFTVYALINRQPQVTEDKTLTVYMPFDEVKTYEKISADFAAANPNIELVFKYIEAKDAKEYEAKVVNEIADGEGPDVWLVRSDWIPKHAAKSIAFEATSEQSDPIASAKTVIEPAIVDLNTYKDKLYGIPLFADSLAVIYNLTMYNDVAAKASVVDKAEMTKFPATWDIVKKQSEIVTQNKNSVITRSAIALGSAETMYAPVDVLSAMLLQHGAALFTEDESAVAFNLAQFKDGKSSFPATSALNLFTSFSKSTEPNYSWNNDLGDAIDAFKAQKTGAVIGYFSLFSSLAGSSLGFDLGVAPLSQLTEGADRVDFGVTWSHLVNSQTNKKAKSLELLTYFTTEKVQSAYVDETSKISPALISGKLESKIQGESASKTVFNIQLKTVKQLTKTEWQLTDEVLQETIKLITNAGNSTQSAIDSAAARLKELLD